jgi:aquaporin Z
MNVLRRHYPEYLMEAAGLGCFMIVASSVTIILVHPASLVHQALVQGGLTDPLWRRLITGVAMGLTAIAIIYSPWGKQSGAHLNPVVTLTFFRLGKVKPVDAFFYILSQFSGGVLGLGLAAAILSRPFVKLPEGLAHPSISYIVTRPGAGGAGAAFLGELIISFGMMMMVLVVSNTPKLARLTGLFAGILIATYITLEAPLSGMSMNPARTLASAISAHNWTAIWVYFTAPPLGMLSASEVYIRWAGRQAVRCAKLNHHNNRRCIFRCGYRDLVRGNGSQLLSDLLPHP